MKEIARASHDTLPSTVVDISQSSDVSAIDSVRISFSTPFPTPTVTIAMAATSPQLPLPSTSHSGNPNIIARPLDFNHLMSNLDSDTENLLYVDKSLAIEPFMSCRGAQVLLRPRRSGKTLFLQLLKCVSSLLLFFSSSAVFVFHFYLIFMQCGFLRLCGLLLHRYFLESEHSTVRRRPSKETRLQRMRNLQFEVLRSSETWDYRDHFAKYPVVHLDFKVRRVLLGIITPLLLIGRCRV